MRELVIVFGPPAVGKMTVGQELAQRTGFKLFHGHMSIELAYAFFDFGTPEHRRLSGRIRAMLFDALAESNLAGVVFTYCWAFNFPADKDYVDAIVAKFAAHGARASFVELEARLDVRLDRNRQPSRLLAKPSKRDLARSEGHLLSDKYRLNTTPEEPFYYPERYLKLETSELLATEAARRITEHFGFAPPGVRA
jgi:hypothetical protein